MSEAIIERLLLEPGDIGLNSIDHPILEQAFESYIARSVSSNPRLENTVVCDTFLNTIANLPQAPLLHVPTRDAQVGVQEQRLFGLVRQGLNSTGSQKSSRKTLQKLQ